MGVFDDAKKLQGWFERVKSERMTVDTIRQEIADNEFGSRDFTTTSRSVRDRSPQIYDTTALFANQLLAGALHGLITNPAAVWFELRAANPRLMLDFEVRSWLEHVRDQMLMVMNTPGSGFTTNLAEIYLDIPGFGMGALWIQEDPEFGVRYSARPLREVYVEDDDLGQIDVVFRCIEPTARQFAIRFPKPLNEIRDVENALKNDMPETRIKVMHLIAKSDDPYAGTSPFRKKWVSVCWADGKSGPALIERKGYDELPLITPRWRVETGEVYGRGAGWTALADAKMLNVMQKTIVKAAQKAADPPLLVSDEAVLSGIRTMPGGVNYVQDRPGIGGQPDAIRPLQNNARIDIGIELIDRKIQGVRNAFWSQTLQMFEDPRMSATQVIQLATQAQRMMAPVTGRTQQELTDPLLARTFSIMARAGYFEPPPESLRGETLELSYVSPFSRAQRASEAEAVMRTWQAVAMIAQAAGSADALDVLDPMESARVIAEANAVPLKIVRDVRDVQRLQAQRANLAEEDRMMSQAGQGAQVLEQLTKALAPVQQAAA